MGLRLLVFTLVFVSSWVAATDSESKWSPDGWSADFGPGVCYLWQNYFDRDVSVIGITNVRFMKMIDLKESYPDADYASLPSAFLDAGVNKMELVFSASLPDKNSFSRSDIIAKSVSVGGFTAEQIAMTSSYQEYDWTEFLIREPHSKVLLSRIQNGDAVVFVVVGSDGKTVEFVYDEKPDIKFRIRHSQFNACVRAMSDG